MLARHFVLAIESEVGQRKLLAFDGEIADDEVRLGSFGFHYKERMMASSTTSQVEFSELEELVDRLKSTVQKALEEGRPVDQLEQEVFNQLLGLGHSLMGSLFAAMKEGDVGPTVEKNGKTLRRLPQKFHRTYYSIFGKFDIHRCGYGTRMGQKKQAIPFDEHLGMPDHPFSLLLESWLGQFATGASYQEARDKLEQILGVQINMDSAERIAERLGKVGASVLDSPPPIDPGTEGEILVQTSDNKGVVMRHEFPAETPQPVGAPIAARGPTPNRKRMAAMAGVYSIDRNPRTCTQIIDMLFHTSEVAPPETKPPKPCNPRYYACVTQVDKNGQCVGKSAEEQAQAWMTYATIMRRQPGQTLVIMHDGQASLWEQADQYHQGWEKVEILDLLHVIPRVWEAGKLLHPEALETFVKERLTMILLGGVGMVISGLKRMASMHDLSVGDRQKLSTITNYMETNRSRMKYDQYLLAGLPIATGFIEGACRHVIKDRLERTGMRWTRQGAQTMLTLRCIEASRLWKPLMNKYRSQTLDHHGGRKNYYDSLCTAA